LEDDYKLQSGEGKERGGRGGGTILPGLVVPQEHTRLALQEVSREYSKKNQSDNLVFGDKDSEKKTELSLKS
jgi:hypothetical protein